MASKSATTTASGLKESGDAQFEKNKDKKTCCHHKRVTIVTENGDKEKHVKNDNNQMVTTETQIDEKESAECQYALKEEKQSQAKDTPLATKSAFPAHQSGSALKHTPKLSKIPRTKSFNDDKNKCSMVDQTSNEGAVLGKPHCSKKCHRESTYSNLHQKSKTLKADSITKL